jgi:NAD(P)-dependent dehydrogenase (short-subunit alcohol dehydrogenase family)
VLGDRRIVCARARSRCDEELRRSNAASETTLNPILEDRRAVVIGGTHGIGLALAKSLLSSGARVVITGTDERTIETLRAELGARATLARVDLAVPSDLDALAAIASESPLDAVFFNAGFAALTPLATTSEAIYDRTFAVNTKGAFFAAQRLAPLVRDGGALVFTTSIANESGEAAMIAYAGAKAAVRAFVRCLAAELAPRHVRVNAVSPGFVATPTRGVRDATAEDRAAFEEHGRRTTPLGRIGQPEEIARALLFLAFEATFVTGVELPVDGGLGQI